MNRPIVPKYKKDIVLKKVKNDHGGVVIDSFTRKTIPNRQPYFYWNNNGDFYSVIEPITKDDMYYLQNGFVGNAIAWWAHPEAQPEYQGYNGGGGYTTDFTNASPHTKESAFNQIKCRPHKDRAWLCSEIDNNKKAQKFIIDSQYLDHTKSVMGDDLLTKTEKNESNN